MGSTAAKQSFLASSHHSIDSMAGDFTYTAEVDRVTESEWPALMDRFEDANIYQTWSYGGVRWGESNLSHLILKRGTEVVGIAQLRIVRPTALNIGIAYLRWGPLCNLRGKEIDSEIVKAMASALRKEYVNKRSLYLQILPNAFVNSKRAEIFQTSFAQFDGKSAVESLQYRTFLLDISLPLEGLRKKLDKKWRNQLNASERNNLEVLELEGSDAYKKFSALYAQMWERKKFETSVNVDEFGRIQQQLPANQRMKIFICRHENQEVAGLVCSAIGDTGIYLLGASNEAAMKLKASYVLQWAVIQHLKNAGIRYYDLGGINPLGNPGVYHFKSGLSGVDMAHMNSLIACENGFSSAFAKTGHAVQRNLRRLQHAFAKA